jgi:hypothetical protein
MVLQRERLGVCEEIPSHGFIDQSSDADWTEAGVNEELTSLD